MSKQVKIMTFMSLLLVMFFSCTHAQEKSKNKECPKVDSVVNVDETNLQQKDSLRADNRNKEKWGPDAPINEETDTVFVQKFNLPVFERKSGKMVGYMGSGTIGDENKEYYVLDTLTVLGHQVISKDAVLPYISYDADWYINVKELNDTAEIAYTNAICRGCWSGLYLTKGKNGSLKIIKFVDIYSKQIHLNNPCNQIRVINLNETVRGVIDTVELYERLEKEGRCINCPYKYSYTEALQFLEEGRTRFDRKEYDEEPYDYYDDDR